jgi:hypothetical protein
MSRRIPDDVRQTLALYVEHRIQPGGFLTAVLENDLREACGRADDECRECLFDIVCYIYNELPAACWGDRGAVHRWLTAEVPV